MERGRKLWELESAFVAAVQLRRRPPDLRWADMADAANRLVLVRVMPALRDGHFRELYESGDQHVVVSTLIAGQSTNEHVALDGASSRARYPTHAEETAAFRADADGKLMSVESLACAQGSGSRNEVLGHLGLTQARAERPR